MTLAEASESTVAWRREHMAALEAELAGVTEALDELQASLRAADPVAAFAAARERLMVRAAELTEGEP